MNATEFKRARALMPGRVTQAELAELLGVSRSVVSMIESGQREPTPDLVAKMRALAGDSVVREARAGYNESAGLLTLCSDWFIDYLAGGDPEDLQARAVGLLKKIPR